MENFIYFLLGIIFSYLIIPLMENIIEFLTVWFEMMRMKIGAKTVEYTAVIRKSQEEPEPEPKVILGFGQE